VDTPLQKTTRTILIGHSSQQLYLRQALTNKRTRRFALDFSICGYLDLCSGNAGV
jgi:hypothetical protein